MATRKSRPVIAPRMRRLPEVARELGIEYDALWRDVMDGRVPAIQIGPRSFMLDVDRTRRLLARRAAREEASDGR